MAFRARSENSEKKPSDSALVSRLKKTPVDLGHNSYQCGIFQTLPALPRAAARGFHEFLHSFESKKHPLLIGFHEHSIFFLTPLSVIFCWWL
jgi:hypothetical protein